ncbi:MAG: cytochrome c biogenesis CcdA family protein [Candidatus Gastranaerophilaceae bacterium]
MISENLMNISVPVAVAGSFAGGLITSLSPCTLGILPLILAYVCGVDKSSTKTNLFLKLLSFCLGLSSVLAIIGVICAMTGSVFAVGNSSILLLLFASLLTVLGLSLLGVLNFTLPAFVTKIPENNGLNVVVYPFLVGIFFALTASPCSSPVLVAIIGAATIAKKPETAFLMLFSFALGQCVPVVLAGMFASVLKGFRKFQKYSAVLIKLSGIIFIVIALFIYKDVFGALIGG